MSGSIHTYVYKVVWTNEWKDIYIEAYMTKRLIYQEISFKYQNINNKQVISSMKVLWKYFNVYKKKLLTLKIYL